MKRTDLDKARTFVGTCLDMCPEKERYMRETRSQLSVFEVVPGTDQVEPRIPVGLLSRLLSVFNHGWSGICWGGKAGFMISILFDLGVALLECGGDMLLTIMFIPLFVLFFSQFLNLCFSV